MVSNACLSSLYLCMEAFGLRDLGMNMSFYTSQITIGSFLYSVALIGWMLKREKIGYFCKNRILSGIGDCSYGIFYIHMAVLMVIGRFVDSDNWFVYWGIRFIFTSVISFGIIYAEQVILRNYKKD